MLAEANAQTPLSPQVRTLQRERAGNRPNYVCGMVASVVKAQKFDH